MTPTILQDCLEKEIKEILENVRLKNLKNEIVPINIYKQYLPAKLYEDDEHQFPYVLVRVGDGEDLEYEGECKTTIIIGIYDDDSTYQGYKDIMNVIQKLRERFLKQNSLEQQFICRLPLKWAVNEEDAYPYYFGGIEINWTIPTILNEEEMY